MKSLPTRRTHQGQLAILQRAQNRRFREVHFAARRFGARMSPQSHFQLSSNDPESSPIEPAPSYRPPHIHLVCTCPPEGTRAERRSHSGSSEATKQRRRTQRGRQSARSHRRTHIPVVLTEPIPANSSYLGPNSHRVADLSPRLPVCLILLPCARAHDGQQTQPSVFGHGFKKNFSNATSTRPHTTPTATSDRRAAVGHPSMEEEAHPARGRAVAAGVPLPLP